MIQINRDVIYQNMIDNSKSMLNQIKTIQYTIDGVYRLKIKNTYEDYRNFISSRKNQDDIIPIRRIFPSFSLLFPLLFISNPRGEVMLGVNFSSIYVLDALSNTFNDMQLECFSNKLTKHNFALGIEGQLAIQIYKKLHLNTALSSSFYCANDFRYFTNYRLGIRIKNCNLWIMRFSFEIGIFRITSQIFSHGLGAYLRFN